RRLAQRNVQYGAVFGLIDPLAAPHCIDTRSQPDAVRQFGELCKNDLIETLPREIHLQTDGGACEALKAARIAGERLARGDGIQAAGMLEEICPHAGAWTRDDVHWCDLFLRRTNSTAVIETRDRIHYILYLCFGQLWENRDRQHLRRRPLRFGEISGRM